MGIIKKTGREPDFESDNSKFGKLAENDFIRNFNNNPRNKEKTLFDVRDKKEYQKIDVDFVIDNDGGTELPNIEEVLSNTKRYRKVEVKYNSRALDTGWITFEVYSHKNAGWGLFTKSDLLYIVFTNPYGETILERAWIYMDKWKEYAFNRETKTRLNWIENEKVFDILHELNDMKNKGIIYFI